MSFNNQTSERISKCELRKTLLQFRDGISTIIKMQDYFSSVQAFEWLKCNPDCKIDLQVGLH